MIFAAKEILAYRNESLSGDSYALQLFEDGTLIYKTFDPGVRNGVYLKAECFAIKETPLFQACHDLIHKLGPRCARLPSLPRVLTREEAMVINDAMVGDTVIGSLFLHHSTLDYLSPSVPALKNEEMQAAAGDLADAFSATFFAAYPTLPKLENSPDVDYIDSFIEKDIHEQALHPDSIRTRGLEKSLRPCLNSFPQGDWSSYLEPAVIAGVIQTEDYLNEKLLPSILLSVSQQDLDGRMRGLIARCKNLSHTLFDEQDYELYLSTLLFVDVLQGKIKSASLLRWLHPNYHDVLFWRGAKDESYFFDIYVQDPLKYYRYKCEKEKQLPIFYYLSWRIIPQGRIPVGS